MKMDINIGHGGGVGKGSLNVFAQLAEPKIKDGIWIKTEYIKTSQMLQLKELPRETQKRSAVAIGNEIYMPMYVGKSMKYNVVADEYRDFASIPNSFKGQTAVVNNDIYLFGVFTSSAYALLAYKYDILTNTYTQLKNVPYQFSNGSVVSIGTDIYLIGSNASSYQKYLYKYNTLTDVYTKLKNLPDVAYSTPVCAIGTYIYMFSIGNATKYAYKYNILTDTYTKLSDIPYSFGNCSATPIGTDIYLLGSGDSANSQGVYKYDTLTNTYTKMADVPYQFYDGSIVSIGTDIYLIGGGDSKKIVYRYNTNKEFEEISKYEYNKLVITPNMPSVLENGNIYALYGNTYNAKLLEKEILNFANVLLYKDGETQAYPIYLGNGQEWVKILN